MSCARDHEISKSAENERKQIVSMRASQGETSDANLKTCRKFHFNLLSFSSHSLIKYAKFLSLKFMLDTVSSFLGCSQTSQNFNRSNLVLLSPLSCCIPTLLCALERDFNFFAFRFSDEEELNCTRELNRNRTFAHRCCIRRFMAFEDVSPLRRRL